MSRLGSRVSSAASGTPSIARKNQMAYGNAAQMPAQPKGRKSLAPAESSGGMSVRFEVENDRRDRERDLQRLADAEQLDADEDRVEGEVHRPAGRDPEDVERLDVGADERDDRRGGEHVLDEDRGAGEEAAPWAECPAAEAVPAAGRGDRR
jgi:hypothetical protein